jgi:hypothetical protein
MGVGADVLLATESPEVYAVVSAGLVSVATLAVCCPM